MNIYTEISRLFARKETRSYSFITTSLFRDCLLVRRCNKKCDLSRWTCSFLFLFCQIVYLRSTIMYWALISRIETLALYRDYNMLRRTIIYAQTQLCTKQSKNETTITNWNYLSWRFYWESMSGLHVQNHIIALTRQGFKCA